MVWWFGGFFLDIAMRRSKGSDGKQSRVSGQEEEMNQREMVVEPEELVPEEMVPEEMVPEEMVVEPEELVPEEMNQRRWCLTRGDGG